ncbi:MAG: cobalamin biosynthesis protein, partial [Blautia faecis]
ENDIYPEAVAALASIDVKKEEPGLLALSEKLGVPFKTFSSEELLSVQGEFTSSSFVSKTVGVDNVCERSAVKAAENYTGVHFIQRKRGAEGVTTALVLGDWRIHFE